MQRVVLVNLSDGTVRTEFLRSAIALLTHARATHRRIAGFSINTGGPRLGVEEPGRGQRQRHGARRPAGRRGVRGQPVLNQPRVRLASNATETRHEGAP